MYVARPPPYNTTIEWVFNYLKRDTPASQNPVLPIGGRGLIGSYVHTYDSTRLLALPGVGVAYFRGKIRHD